MHKYRRLLTVALVIVCFLPSFNTNALASPSRVDASANGRVTAAARAAFLSPGGATFTDYPGTLLDGHQMAVVTGAAALVHPAMPVTDLLALPSLQALFGLGGATGRGQLLQVAVKGVGAYTFTDAGEVMLDGEVLTLDKVPSLLDLALNPNAGPLQFVDPEINPQDLKIKSELSTLLASYGIANPAVRDEMISKMLQTDRISGLNRQSLETIQNIPLTRDFYEKGYQIVDDEISSNLRIGEIPYLMIDQGDSDFCYLAAYLLMMQSYLKNDKVDFIENVFALLTPMNIINIKLNLLNDPQKILNDFMNPDSPYFQGMSSTHFLNTLQALEHLHYNTNDFQMEFLQSYLENRWLMVHTHNWHGLSDGTPAHFIYILAIHTGTDIVIVGCNPLGGTVELINLQYLQDHTEMIHVIPKEMR